MSMFKSRYATGNQSWPGYHDCRCDNEWPPPCPKPCSFLSCYIEAVADTQVVAPGENIAFDTDPDALDIVGNGIEIDETGKIFTITRAGLYHIEWSGNIHIGANPRVIGLLENGYPASALSNTSLTGVMSSGALIAVEENDLPFTISLHNFGESATLASADGYQNTAASIRILRFADGAYR